jgi:regulator of protease activity HflC (stomatin/prohibitin superfamily)
MGPFLIALLALLVIFLLMGVRVVRQGFVYTIERLGKFTLAAEPGLHLIIPFIDRVGQKVNVMEQVLDIPGQEIITRDNAMVGVDAVVFFQVLDAGKAAYEVHNLYAAIMAITTTNLRTVMGSMDLDETLSKRDEIIAQEYTKAIGKFATSPNAKTILFPIEATQLIGTLGGIGELAREMLGEGSKGGVTTDSGTPLPRAAPRATVPPTDRR